MRVTTPTRTIIDLAAVVDARSLRAAFESARRMRLTTVEHVARRFAAISGRGLPGGAALRRLLAQLDPSQPAGSPLEVVVAELLSSSDLPRPVAQHPVKVGGRRYRLDFAWPEQRVALECDGRLRHFEDSDFQNDRARWSSLAIDGWRIVFATWSDAHGRPEWLLGTLRLALAA
jgi:hypothetical protein